MIDKLRVVCCFKELNGVSVVAAGWLAVKPRSSSKEHHLQMTLYSWYVGCRKACLASYTACLIFICSTWKSLDAAIAFWQQTIYLAS